MEDDQKSKNENEPGAESEPSEVEKLLGQCYEICIGGKLDSSWSDWFDGFEMSGCGKDWTMLCGRVADQAALLGILNKLCGLNLPLVSVNEVDWTKFCTDQPNEGDE